tara:strand:+ start:23001 stop:23144 length:144 start_codon:yes stop_codon:yes gene_type:complete
MKTLSISEQQKLNEILINHKENGDWQEQRVYTNLLVKLIKTKIKRVK